MTVRSPFAFAFACAIAGACRADRPVGPPASVAGEPTPAVPAPVLVIDDPLVGFLPPGVGAFTGGPLERGPGFVRRVYERGRVRINVTIGRRTMTDDEYGHWVRSSTDYEPAVLEIPAGAASGFYDCSGPAERRVCSLHIQLRAGYHVEIMGGGTASRADVSDLASALPLAALVTRAP